MTRTILNKQEKQWILERRIQRLTDEKEVQIYPMGAERYLSSALSSPGKHIYDIKSDISGKHVLLIPGHGNSAFLLVQAGARSVTVYDKDPVTIAWVKAFKQYFHYRQSTVYPSVGELLTALTHWHPPLLKLPTGLCKRMIWYTCAPNALRRAYIHYMVSLVREVVQTKTSQCFELDEDIQFYTGTVDKLCTMHSHQTFDTVFVPYLLGVRNGIEKAEEIVRFIQQLLDMMPTTRIFVTPSRNTKEFYMVGKRYYLNDQYQNIQDIPGLSALCLDEDKRWFQTQGLVVFGKDISY